MSLGIRRAMQCRSSRRHLDLDFDPLDEISFTKESGLDLYFGDVSGNRVHRQAAPISHGKPLLSVAKYLLQGCEQSTSTGLRLDMRSVTSLVTQHPFKPKTSGSPCRWTDSLMKLLMREFSRAPLKQAV